jgi:hypothetical protein
MAKIKNKIVHKDFKIEFDKSISQVLRAEVLEVFNQYADRTVIARKSKRWAHMTIEIGLNYRAIKRNGSDRWYVCSHELYNRLINIK